MPFQVRYASAPADGRWLTVDVIAKYNRADDSDMVMSSSSGPKDYFKNSIAAAFHSQQAITHILAVRANGPMFLLLKAAHLWFDVTGQPVQFQGMVPE